MSVLVPKMAELAPQARDEEGHVQYVNLVRKDVILERILEHHDVVECGGAADQRCHPDLSL